MTELRNTIICGDCLGEIQLGPYALGPNNTPENGIYCGDARELAEAIPDESVDLVFTDPPYSKEYLPLYEWLARASKRILTTDGFLIAMAGNYWKDRIFEMVGQHLEYFWDYQMDMRQGGRNSIIWPRKTIALAKSLLAYRKSSGLPRCNVLGLWSGSKQDKRYHAWGQDESSARYYTDCFSSPGQIVVDPFAGGGTVPAICKILRRKYLAFEIDPDVCEMSRERVRNTQRPWFVPGPEQLPLLERAL